MTFFFGSQKCIMLSAFCILFAVGPKFGNQIGKPNCPPGNRLTAQAGWQTGKTTVIRIFNYTCDADDATVMWMILKLTIINLPAAIDQSLGQRWYNFLIERDMMMMTKSASSNPAFRCWITGGGVRECVNPVTSALWPSGGVLMIEIVQIQVRRLYMSNVKDHR